MWVKNLTNCVHIPKSVVYRVKNQLNINILFESHYQSCWCVCLKSKYRRVDSKPVVNVTNGGGTLSNEPLFGDEDDGERYFYCSMVNFVISTRSCYLLSFDVG